MIKKKKYEIIRAFWHIGISLILVWLANYVKPTVLSAFAFLIVAIIELIRLKIPWFNKNIINHKRSFLSRIIRREETNDFSAMFTASLAVFIISWLPLHLFKTAILINAFADPSARMFGVRWGKKKILNTKNSWVGSSAFLVTAFLVAIYFVPMSSALLVALVGAIAEGVPDKKPFWVDNLRIPVCVGLVLWLLV